MSTPLAESIAGLAEAIARSSDSLRQLVHVSEYPTRLSDGRLADRHCDWDCLQDLIAAGILATRGIPDLGKKVTITTRGFVVTAALRQHKADGGNFANFRAPKETA